LRDAFVDVLLALDAGVPPCGVDFLGLGVVPRIAGAFGQGIKRIVPALRGVEGGEGLGADGV
jgi:hypothetical protein